MKKLLIVSAVALSTLLLSGVTKAGESAQSSTEETRSQSTPEVDDSIFDPIIGDRSTQDVCYGDCDILGYGCKPFYCRIAILPSDSSD